MPLEISQIQICPLRPNNGFLGFAACVVNNQFFVGNIAIYSSPLTKVGFRLVFPNKKLASGQVVDCFFPINKESEQQVTKAIIAKYVELMDGFNHVDIV